MSEVQPNPGSTAAEAEERADEDTKAARELDIGETNLKASGGAGKCVVLMKTIRHVLRMNEPSHQRHAEEGGADGKACEAMVGRFERRESD